MKRSEMIDEIQTLIFEYRNSFATTDFIAEEILKLVEKKGMKPPFLEYTLDRSLGESRIYVENYKWDKENADIKSFRI